MESPRQLTEFALAKAHEFGFDLAGVCSAAKPASWPYYAEWIKKGSHGSMSYLETSLDLRSDPARLLEGVRSIVAVGINYHQSNPAVQGEPRVAQYALGRDYHRTVRAKLRKLQTALQDLLPAAEFRVCVDSAPILEREFAHRAGLGWFGKNTCLIDSKRGSWFLIGLLLTTADLESTGEATGGCGTCRLCIDACPTGAIVQSEGRWQVDARRCLSYHTIENRGEIPADIEPKLGEWTFGCDVCQEVCPFNQPRASQPLRARSTVEPDFLAKRQWPNLIQLTQMGEAEWDKLTRGSPVRRAGLRGLKRNAAINLKNASRTKGPSV